ncbi:hypothetical protein GCM10018787_07960 [Streptomyces thermodiastaticus]|nr:hypothetical protein GCM10018787_07960 [Streptomyces thermodiastaticus]
MAEHERDHEAAENLREGGDSPGPADGGTSQDRTERGGGTPASGAAGRERSGAGEAAAADEGTASGDAASGATAGTTGAAGSGAAGSGVTESGARGAGRLPLDEEAAWAAIVAGYGEEPPDPPGARPFRPVEDDERAGRGPGGAGRSAPRLGGSVSFAPGVGPAGPRDYALGEPSDDDFDEDDEGHFVPPEPPPLPEADTTAKFAWLGVVGGPVLLLLAVVLGWDMTWWLTTVCVGGFLGGIATLVARMNPGDDEDDDPGRGAVV